MQMQIAFGFFLNFIEPFEIEEFKVNYQSINDNLASWLFKVHYMD